MIITCPNCDARYLIQANAVSNGKKIKCASCEHVWVYEAEPEENAEGQDLLQEADTIPSAIRPDVDDIKTKSKSNNKRLSFYALLGTFTTFVVILLALILLKAPLIGAVPGMAKLYTSVGLYELRTEPTLIFDQTYVTKKGRGYVISGNIINLLPKETALPFIEVVALDKNGVILGKPLYVKLEPDNIKAESIHYFDIPFVQNLRPHDFELRFVMEAIGEPVIMRHKTDLGDG